MGGIITLTTDFGTADAYVAAMKGVILGINPEVRLVDISHSIEPQNIAGAAYILGTAYQYFPERTVHLVVVDPGVGMDRRGIILRTPEADFVAPDNGVLSYIIEKYAISPATGERYRLDTSQAQAIEITNPKFRLPDISTTFHGRDIFAPVAAHLSRGVLPVEFGEAIDSLVVLPSTQPAKEPDGSLVGRVINIDRFGDLITNIKKTDLPGNNDDLIVEIRGRQIHGLVTTYAEMDGLGTLIGSSGRLEIALKDGSAAELLDVSTGETVKIKIRG
jgi:S-adenosylmethionine hydrolase